MLAPGFRSSAAASAEPRPCHMVQMNRDVNIFGMLAKTDDHPPDFHGAVVIPHDAVKKLPAATTSSRGGRRSSSTWPGARLHQREDARKKRRRDPLSRYEREERRGGSTLPGRGDRLRLRREPPRRLGDMRTSTSSPSATSTAPGRGGRGTHGAGAAYTDAAAMLAAGGSTSSTSPRPWPRMRPSPGSSPDTACAHRAEAARPGLRDLRRHRHTLPRGRGDDDGAREHALHDAGPRAR